MIEFIKKGNILDADADADAEAIVNTVNTQGVMGAGFALHFKKAYPDNFKHYENSAKEGQIKIGKIFVTNLARLQTPN